MGLALTATFSATLAAAAPPQAAAWPPPDPPEASVKITSPASGTHTLYGPAHEVHFTASASATWGGCCDVTWKSNLDGTLGTGTTLDHAFTTPGTRTVTVTARSNRGGISGSATVKVIVDNASPTVTIVKPSGPITVYRNAWYKFQGEGFDANLLSGGIFPIGGDVPCGSLVWSRFDPATNQLAGDGTGCKRLLSFSTTGSYQVRLDSTDAFGASAKTAVRWVTVVDKPTNSAPTVSIWQPDDQAYLQPGTTYWLGAYGNDVDGDPITYTWTMKDGSTTKTIGSDSWITWRPADDVPFNCGGRDVTLTVTATDKDGSSTDSIVARVGWGPC